ncbi:MAG: hypothetical protein AAGC74_11325 [Verrucomicrobiota bacterium]
MREGQVDYQVAGSKGSTFRLDENVRAALDKMSEIEKRPKNKIVNDAVARYLQEETQTMKEDLENVALRLKEYRKGDPGFVRAIAEFAAGEAEIAVDDAAEGEVVEGALAKEIRDLAW